jgi:rhamnulokinase
VATMAAVDLGAQSGRVAVGRLDGERLSVVEVHRFPNVPVRVHGTLHWDVLRLYDGLLEGLRAALQESGGPVDAVGVDTWGVDFALLDRSGRLVQDPVHHRDARSERGMRLVLERIPARELYERTGIQLMPINTVFQLASMVAEDDPALDAAQTLLLVPDLLHYWLSGVVASERTNATTTACLDARSGDWAADLLARLGIPPDLFPELVAPATVLGPLRDDVAEETALRGTTVVAPATHDTASAVASVPFRRPGAAYISAGTWSLVGLELSEPLIDDRSFAANLTNEGGVQGTLRVLRNVTGLWLLHECRRAWALEGVELSFDELVTMAGESPPHGSLIDPDDPSFAAPGDMPGRIRAFCVRTGQEAPETPGAIARCALESIAFSHRRAIDLLREAAGAGPPEIHVVGGGARNALLCRWTADATSLPVLAGPAEATVIGNLLVQALALGELGSLEEAREVVRASFAPTLYEPSEHSVWEEAYGRFEAIASANGRATEEALAP